MTPEEKYSKTRLPELIQCDGCLLFFRHEDVTKECECGAYLCMYCKLQGKIVACYCSC